MANLAEGLIANAMAGSEVADLKKDFKAIDNDKFAGESEKIVKAVCASIAGTDDNCADEAGYSERESPKEKILNLAKDLLQDALSVDEATLIKYLTEYQSVEEKIQSITAKDETKNNNDTSAAAVGETCNCPKPDVNESENDSMIEQIAVAVAGDSAEKKTDIASSDNTKIVSVAVAAAADDNIEVMSGGADPDVPAVPGADALGAVPGADALGADVPDIPGAAIPGVPGAAIPGVPGADALGAGAVPDIPGVPGADALGAIPGAGALGALGAGIPQAEEGNKNSADAKEILKMYTNRMVSTIKCNQLAYNEIKTFLDNAYRFGKEELQQDKIDIIKESLKSHSDLGRKNMNQTRIRIYKQNLEYLKNVDTEEGIEAYIHIVDDMHPFLTLAHLHEDGEEPLAIIKQYVSKIKSKSSFKEVLENTTFPNTIKSKELISELGLNPTTKEDQSNIREGTSTLSGLASSVFAGAGKQTRKKRTRKYKKPINNRTR